MQDRAIGRELNGDTVADRERERERERENRQTDSGVWGREVLRETQVERFINMYIYIPYIPTIHTYIHICIYQYFAS